MTLPLGANTKPYMYPHILTSSVTSGKLYTTCCLVVPFCKLLFLNSNDLLLAFTMLIISAKPGFVDKPVNKGSSRLPQTNASMVITLIPLGSSRNSGLKPRWVRIGPSRGSTLGLSLSPTLTLLGKRLNAVDVELNSANAPSMSIWPGPLPNTFSKTGLLTSLTGGVPGRELI